MQQFPVDSLRSQAADLPDCPGVYLWRAIDGEILYVGKAVRLRARVASYFSSAGTDSRVAALLEAAAAIDHEVAATELEALLRESALIKQHQPRFNRLLLKGRPSYYLRLDRSRQDPHIEVTDSRELEPADHLGPFPSRRIANETLAFLHQLLPLRKCAKTNPDCRKCSYFQMQTCSAPPLGGEYRDRHEEALARLAELCEGRSDRVRAWLEAKRDRLSQSLLFEQAGDLQMRLELLSRQERDLALLEAAARSRYVVVREGRGNAQRRFLLIARGRVVSVRDDGKTKVADLVSWVRAHERILPFVRAEQGELDAADVLQRWLRSCRQETRWIVIPDRADDEELADRLRYVSGAIRRRPGSKRRRTRRHKFQKI